MLARRKTREVTVGDIKIGGGAPVALQSMTSGPTHDADNCIAEIHVPLKVAVMGCVVNGPGECEGADVALFAGRGKGIIYVQGEQKQTVPESQMLDALLRECRALATNIEHGEAALGDIVPTEAPPSQHDES